MKNKDGFQESSHGFPCFHHLMGFAGTGNNLAGYGEGNERPGHGGPGQCREVLAE
jgi:hypothetical protein